MLQAPPSSLRAVPSQTDATAPVLLVSSVFADAEVPTALGRDAYSYHFVYRAFRTLLQRLGRIEEIDRPESRLDYAGDRARRAGHTAIHLGFQPLQLVYLSSLVPNVAVPFWEFPDIPDEDIDGNPRHNWARVAAHLDGIICASAFTRAAFVKAGVRTPIHVVPVPIRDEYFALSAWTPTERAQLAAPVHLLAPRRSPGIEPPPWDAQQPRDAVAAVHAMGQGLLRATLPRWLDHRVGQLGQALRRRLREAPAHPMDTIASRTLLESSPIVYTSFVNPFDQRKNWGDLLSAFLLALRDHDDALLIIKLVTTPSLIPAALQRIADHYARVGIAHRCKVAIVSSYLSDGQLVELTRLSTYYLTATRAEGACLPAQDFLAASRPVVGPSHTAMAEYLDPDVAFVVESHPEPTWWPHDPSKNLRTSWHRVVWQSLHDRIRESYEVAARDRDRYARMAQSGRARMRDFAAPERVWPRLRAALDDVGHAPTAVR